MKLTCVFSCGKGRGFDVSLFLISQVSLIPTGICSARAWWQLTAGGEVWHEDVQLVHSSRESRALRCIIITIHKVGSFCTNEGTSEG